MLYCFLFFLVFITVYFSLLYFLADEYEKSQSKRLDSFFSSTADSFTHPEVRKRKSESGRERGREREREGGRERD